MAVRGKVSTTEVEGQEGNSVEAAMAQADRAERRLRDAIDAFPEGIVFLDEDGCYLLWNEKYAEIYSATADLFKPGARLADTLRIGVQRGDYPEAQGREEEWLAERLSLLENPGVRHEQRLADGRCIMIEERKTGDGCTIGLRVDITELKQREEAFRLLFEDNPMPLLVYDPACELIRSANAAAVEHFGFSDEQFTDLPAREIFAEGQWQHARQALANPLSRNEHVWKQRTRSGEILETMLFSRQTSWAGKPYVIVSVFDVTERRRVEARMAHMARHDELTGLLNRSHCREVLQELLADRGQGEIISVALVDLDHFKTVNDTHGHQIGDLLLANAASRMLELIPKRAMLCRIGGDEFAIVFRNSSTEQVKFVLKSISHMLARPFFIGDHSLHIGATIGSAVAPWDSSDPETLMRYADLALYAAKAERRGSCREFKPSMDEAAQRKTRLETDLREAIHKGHLRVHYQPLINLDSSETAGYEALVRWTHPEFGPISPERFIPIVEDIGLIDALGQFVLREACRQATGWPEHQTVAVNVSPVQFRSGNLLNIVIQALASTGLQPHRLELEITEAVLMEKGQIVSDTIRNLRTLGVGISMDDFGTGYSSLSYLMSYPFTKIKIDKSFIINLASDPSSFAIIRAVIGLGKSLGLAVTAEGIENDDVRQILITEGCSQGQGFLFGAAQPQAKPGFDQSQSRVA